jgi:hypothetical protein
MVSVRVCRFICPSSYGFVVGTTSGGDLWIQNQAGVIMHLKAKRTGLMLSLGGDES